MATTNILQYLESTGKSVTTGADVQLGTSPLNRLQTETFLTETAITKGQLVAVDVAKMATDATGGLTALTVIASDFNSAPVQKIVIGVAAESVTGTATSPQLIKVIQRGPASSVPLVTVGCAVGDALCLDTAGVVVGGCMVASAATFTHVIGYALETVAAAGNIRVFVLGAAT
jgi:hypothetical protein